MTVITVTAVGFHEVHPLSELGRDSTMVLLAAGITGLGVWFALITSFILEFDLTDVRAARSGWPRFCSAPKWFPSSTS